MVIEVDKLTRTSECLTHFGFTDKTICKILFEFFFSTCFHKLIQNFLQLVKKNEPG